jgi:ABC-type multidrug transport system ATPase subunit
MSLAIETKNLHYRSGRGANAFHISHLDMHVPEGAVYGFLGPNGSGKTTTIRLLLGLLKPDDGTITVLGEPMPANYPSVLRRTGYMPERPHLYPTLTVREAMVCIAFSIRPGTRSGPTSSSLSSSSCPTGS